MNMHRITFCTLVGALTLLLSLQSSGAAQIARESFEGASSPLFSTTGLISSPDQFFLSQNDFWTTTDGNNIVSGSSAGSVPPAVYTGQDGSRFWAGQDLDASDDNTDTLLFGPIPIAGFINLSFSGLFAADGLLGGNPATPRYDTGEGLEVAWSIDGGPFNTALAFKPESAASNVNIRKDTDLNGIGEGAILGPAFSSHAFSISGSGANLTIRVKGISDGSQEEFAFDDLTIEGDPSVVNQPPTVSFATAPDVGEAEIGQTSYSFTVTYSDDSGVDATTIDALDVTVTGPGGALSVTSGSTVDPTGSPLTATYTVTPPGGSWDAADNGVYSISAASNQVGDDGGPQLFVAAGLVSTFNVNAVNTAPIVTVVVALDVGASDLGATSYSFTVEYSDLGGVNASSIDASDVTVTGPGGPLAVVSGATGDPDGSPLTATYTITPPGGTWDAGDAGTYTIGLLGSQVLDVLGASVAADLTLATFAVDPSCLAVESFEQDGPGYDSGLITSPDEFYSSTSDFWTATDATTLNPIISGSSGGGPAIYSGQAGSRYWAGQDLNHLGPDGSDAADVDTVIFGPIPVSGAVNLAFNGLFAADGLVGGNPATPRYDTGEGLEVAWSIDGGPFNTALAFKAESAASNVNIRKDTDLDGVGDGAILGPAFSPHGFAIPGSGSSLTIRVTGIADAAQEEFAFDNLKVTGTASGVNQAPTVSFATAPDVGEAEIGQTSYSFTVTYSDDSGVDATTIDALDVTVTGPGGALSVTSGSTVDPTGSPLTATYTVTPPGGSWDAADNGVYSISAASNQVGDDGGPQLFVAAGLVSTFNVNAVNTAPIVTVVVALDVGASDLGATSYSFTVEYSDLGGVNASSIDASDVTVTGPGGPLAVVSGATGDPDGSPLTATYTITPPGGTWDAGDAGTYTIGLLGSQVLDVLGASVAADLTLATFAVDPSCLAVESFEQDGPGYDSGLITSPDEFYSSTSDFWTATDATTLNPIISGSSGGGPAIYSGQAGSRYWAGQDLNHLGPDGSDAADVDTVIFGPIPVSGAVNLAFNGLFAADGLVGGNPATPRYDTGEGLEVAWSIDGGPFNTALAFKAESAASNVNIRKDTDLDGVGDGAILGPAFSPHGFAIPGSGSSLTIRVTGIADAAQEEFAFDNLKVTGNPPAPAPPDPDPDDVDRHPTQSIKIPVATLLANDTDPGGNYPLNVIGASYTGGNGADVFLSDGVVFYDPKGFTGVDTFEYTVENSLGESSTAQVTVHPLQGEGPTFNVTGVELPADGTAVITAVGIPGRAYRVQYWDPVPPPPAPPGPPAFVDFVPTATVVADALGQITFVDPAPNPSARIYRVIHP